MALVCSDSLSRLQSKGPLLGGRVIPQPAGPLGGLEGTYGSALLLCLHHSLWQECPSPQASHQYPICHGRVIYNIQKISNYLNNQQQVTRQLNRVHTVEEVWALSGALPILASLWSSLHVSWVPRPRLNLFFPCDSRRSKVICATDRWRPS